MYNAMHLPPEYSSDNEGQKSQSTKVNGFGAVGAFKSSVSFTSFPNSNRTRHHAASLGGSSYRDALSHPFSTTDGYNPSSLMTSAQSQPQLSAGHVFDSFHQGRGFDFAASGQPPNGDRKQSYGFVDLGGGPSSALLQSHQIGTAKTVGGSLSLHGPHQQQHPGFGHHSASQNPYSGSIHIQSQTPYGPHLSTNGIGGGSGVGNNPIAMNHTTSISSVNLSQEEISTIFVVGFPEDMQEREFQNMFTFCAGFEAATLKIPNKEYTAYGNATGPVPSGSMRSGPNGMNYPQSFAGPNDPYNLVTVNQGGVVVDGGRDGPLSSWPATVPGMLQDEGNHFGPGGGSMQAMPPRKQIIGFAKFRTRQEALDARDVLQGRRVDIEKGAVLKAEMAKKNLHTKRGVGPLPLQLPGVMSNGSGNMGPHDPMALNNSLNVTMNNMANLGINPSSALETLSARDREMGALGAMGLGPINQWREASRLAETEEERDRRRDREAGTLNAMGFGSSTRGPRERAEEDERERERRRKEKEARLRSTNLTAFDAFHSVPSQTISRHPSNSLLSRTASIDNNSMSSSLLVNGGIQMLGQPNMNAQDDRFSGNLPGPWDSVNLNGPRKVNISVPSNPPIRPPSSSRQSPSGRDAAYSSPLNNSADLPQQPSLLTHEYSLSSELDKQPFLVHNQPPAAVLSSQPSSRAPSIVGDAQNSDAEVEGGVASLVVSTVQGDTSPQLPSPISGASSTSTTSTRNLVDQNPPINTLYVGNLPTAPVPTGYPPNYLEESLRELFQRRPGFRKLCFRQKSNGPMCFVEFEDVNYATKALNDLYGNTLGGLIKGGGIRLSYSKNPLGVRTPTSNGSATHQQQLHVTTSSSFPLDGYTNRAPVDIGTSVVRRDSTVTSPPPSSSNYTFMSSPPPRFFSPTVSSAFGNTANTNGSSFPRSSNNLQHGFIPQHNNNASVSTFSPFGVPTSPHATIPDQPSSDTHDHHFSHNALSPSTNNIEAARAG